MKYIKFPYYYSRPNYALDRPRISDDPLSSELNDPGRAGVYRSELDGFSNTSKVLILKSFNCKIDHK